MICLLKLADSASKALNLASKASFSVCIPASLEERSSALSERLPSGLKLGFRDCPVKTCNLCCFRFRSLPKALLPLVQLLDFALGFALHLLRGLVRAPASSLAALQAPRLAHALEVAVLEITKRIPSIKIVFP